MKNCSDYFQNKKCEFFPCHKTSGDYFNCMFCYCPLYALGDKCGGNFCYTADGIKDCSNCLIPHMKNAKDYILSKFGDIQELARK